MTDEVGFGAGKRFGGRFYLQELINSGGMADIWLVTDERNMPYALRKLKLELRFSLRSRRRFVRGARFNRSLTKASSSSVTLNTESWTAPRICSWITLRHPI